MSRFLHQRRSVGAPRESRHGPKEVPIIGRCLFICLSRKMCTFIWNRNVSVCLPVTKNEHFLYPSSGPEAQSEALRTPQNIPAWTVSWLDDPVVNIKALFVFLGVGKFGILIQPPIGGMGGRIWPVRIKSEMVGSPYFKRLWRLVVGGVRICLGFARVGICLAELEFDCR